MIDFLDCRGCASGHCNAHFTVLVDGRVVRHIPREDAARNLIGQAAAGFLASLQAGYGDGLTGDWASRGLITGPAPTTRRTRFGVRTPRR